MLELRILTFFLLPSESRCNTSGIYWSCLMHKLPVSPPTPTARSWAFFPAMFVTTKHQLLRNGDRTRYKTQFFRFLLIRALCFSHVAQKCSSAAVVSLGSTSSFIHVHSEPWIERAEVLVGKHVGLLFLIPKSRHAAERSMFRFWSCSARPMTTMHSGYLVDAILSRVMPLLWLSPPTVSAIVHLMREAPAVSNTNPHTSFARSYKAKMIARGTWKTQRAQLGESPADISQRPMTTSRPDTCASAQWGSPRWTTGSPNLTCQFLPRTAPPASTRPFSSCLELLASSRPRPRMPRRRGEP